MITALYYNAAHNAVHSVHTKSLWVMKTETHFSSHKSIGVTWSGVLLAQNMEITSTETGNN